jgi:hypothetical protein
MLTILTKKQNNRTYHKSKPMALFLLNVEQEFTMEKIIRNGYVPILQP